MTRFILRLLYYLLRQRLRFIHRLASQYSFNSIMNESPTRAVDEFKSIILVKLPLVITARIKGLI